MASNGTIFHWVDMGIIVGGVVFWLWKYGQLRLPINQEKQGYPLFLMNLVLMAHFYLEAGANAFTQSHVFEFYLSLVGAAAMTFSVVHTHLKLVRALAP